jgi:hypothetical protein
MIFNETVQIILLICLLIVGFTLLSLSLSRHYSHVANKRQRLSTKMTLVYRGVGYSLLIASTALSISTWDIALALVYWFATSSLVTLVLSFILSFKPQWLVFATLDRYKRAR